MFFADYFLHTSDVTFDLANNKMEVHNNYSEPWKVTLVDTGLNTMTGGRVRRIRPFVGDEPFMLTYGDGVANVNLEELEKISPCPWQDCYHHRRECGPKVRHYGYPKGWGNPGLPGEE